MPKPSPEDRALAHRKPCTLCSQPRDVLIRCQIDESGKWHFVCPGKCWQSVSGGVIDGDLAAGHEEYRYGGMWKNKHAGVSAKVPKRLKGKMTRGAKANGGEAGGAGGGGQDEDRESDGSGGSGGSGGSEGSVGSRGSNGSSVDIDDGASGGGTTLVGVDGIVGSQRATVKS